MANNNNFYPQNNVDRFCNSENNTQNMLAPLSNLQMNSYTTNQINSNVKNFNQNLNMNLQNNNMYQNTNINNQFINKIIIIIINFLIIIVNSKIIKIIPLIII